MGVGVNIIFELYWNSQNGRSYKKSKVRTGDTNTQRDIKSRLNTNFKQLYCNYWNVLYKKNDQFIIYIFQIG